MVKCGPTASFNYRIMQAANKYFTIRAFAQAQLKQQMLIIQKYYLMQFKMKNLIITSLMSFAFFASAVS
jgi:hypothetical protein